MFKTIGNVLMGIGATLFILGACYLDSDSYIFLLIAVVGLALLYAGYFMKGDKHGRL